MAAEPNSGSGGSGGAAGDQSSVTVPAEYSKRKDEKNDEDLAQTPQIQDTIFSRGMQSSGNEIESSNEVVESDEHILNFMDSMDSYLILMDSLSSAIRQGWLELASARHSMGTSRVNSSLFNLRPHHASTTLQVENDDTNIELPRFTLCKWASSKDPEKCSEEAKSEEDEFSQNKSHSPRGQHQEVQARRADGGESPVFADNQVQKARSRSLSVFGTLVSPKLHATQLSFETALETLVDISNVRASLMCAYDQVQKDLKAAK